MNRSSVGRTGLARVVRGKLLRLREADFVMAAQVSSARRRRVIVAHLVSCGGGGWRRRVGFDEGRAARYDQGAGVRSV